MTSGAKDKIAREDWLLANPWFWTFLGLSLCIVSWGMMLALGETLSAIRVAAVFLGVLAAGVGVTIRLNSARPSFLDELAPGSRNLVLQGLMVLFALMAVTLTVLLALRVFEINPAGWRLNGLVILWALVCPLSVAAVVACARRGGLGRTVRAVTPAEEGAALLVLAALTTFCASWALYDRDNPQEWDSFRLFLSALVLVALGAAPLVLVSQGMRRLVVSVLVLLHFGGIGIAAMSPAPSPWIVQQIWGRIYQPYLEFMYLNNAYHFYAPDPGPASFLWFRMYFEDPQGTQWAHWIKVPDVDEKGWHKNTLALEYQRLLALTENVVPTDPTPNMYETKPDGSTAYADWYARRMEHSRNPLGPEDVVIGQQAREVTGLVVPYPFFIPLPQQYLPPTVASKELLASYARHVCLARHPEHPDWKVHSVKIYRVVHMIPNLAPFVDERLDPRDPDNYRPYYMGRYDPRGKLLDGGNQYDAQGKPIPRDPFLYWLLPMLRDPPTYLVRSNVKSWVARHADDHDWIYTFDETEQRPLLEEERKALNLARNVQKP